jgi:hypothetical protein
VAFNGKVVLRGRSGSIKLSVRGAHACASAANASSVAFRGSASVTGGTSSFAGARGTLSFKGTFDKTSGAITISFKGRIRY